MAAIATCVSLLVRGRERIILKGVKSVVRQGLPADWWSRTGVHVVQ